MPNIVPTDTSQYNVLICLPPFGRNFNVKLCLPPPNSVKVDLILGRNGTTIRDLDPSIFLFNFYASHAPISWTETDGQILVVMLAFHFKTYL